MFQGTPDGTTMYCTHENKNEAGICPACMGMTASELVETAQFGDMLEHAVESANEAQREIMKTEQEQWEVDFVEFYNEYGKYEHRERGIGAYIKFISQLLKTQHKQTLNMVRKILLNNVITIQDHGTFVKIDPLMDFLEQEITN